MTLFPEMFEPIRSSIIGRAVDNGIIELNIVNIRDYTEDKHCRVDDMPFGGGAGMLMQVQPIVSCYRQNGFAGKSIYMSPRGRKLSQEVAEELAGEGELTILCGHYEGVDERALTELSAEEISIGDYVLTGGELPAMVLVDTVARFVPGVLASDESVLEESVYSGLLEYPQYTRPRTMEEGKVPEVLLSGDHKKIELWRFEQSMILTKERRPDMWQNFVKKFRADEKAYPKKERLLIESVIRD
ncbi:tRNA (guanosine(37)-N1)-methyltransferase TrmD [Mogibacterium pumilum]|uniref:tRNA (guanine-N(1)-)-methyltransferase n=2 Tax=Mogibacterium pumilum TaxID=86332 RepID=A0A223AUD8_9FIRM|nr:tRNA (guanosine(37)-N1)-methyltransferase TrmD [Mogibacterium pumilum]